jgi:hypothetical protein
MNNLVKPHLKKTKKETHDGLRLGRRKNAETSIHKTAKAKRATAQLKLVEHLPSKSEVLISS